MSFHPSRVRTHVQAFEFDKLFVEELGWDIHSGRLDIMLDGETVSLTAIAQKRGMVVYRCCLIPDRATRMKIERQVAKTVHEHVIIYTDPDETEQVWQWVRRELGKPLAQRQEVYRRGQTGERLVQKLRTITFSLDEEEGLTITEVTSRVRAAFDVERVTKRFYDQFKKEHDVFLKFIDGIPDGDWERWYASVMLNRLMFIYFVQKKGFLDSNQDYLRDKLAQTQGNFYRDFLCVLFFHGFAQRESERTPEINRLLGTIPYLNGGLFLKHQIEERYGETIQIANDAFERLFAFFDQYHWHLDERPLCVDNEINPDVLGYIFEKYINQKQMGAYYTKEDITEYIARNTVIPFLFDQARQECRIAFEGEPSVWRLLQDDPDRYIYEAIKKGITWTIDPETENGIIHLDAPLPIPQDIAAGIDDVAQRGAWNTPAPVQNALPTEIWREVVARRQRYEDVWFKLAGGEVQDINDLITYNLNIQQFAQDVIANSEGPELLRAFWKAINRVTVLDPTCGSGAFLFAALNILEPLYEACLERMEAFLAEPDRGKKYGDFDDVIERIEQHPNRRYFILKSIIINNLYGVDIMAEAVEIAKLRLFLKLVAQLEVGQRVEPLPDIDFNIRAGNTLVGFATYHEMKNALIQTIDGQLALPEIERKAKDVDELFKLFRQQQTELGGEVTTKDKAELRKRLKALEDELNQYLARQYNADIGGPEVFERWLASHQPFHWFIEFFGTLEDGGFDVIIGNPPWKEYSSVKKTYSLHGYRTLKCGNLYAICTERALRLRSANGWISFIVQLPLVSSSRMAEARNMLREQSGTLLVIPFDDRPGKLFNGLQHCRSSIFISRGSADSDISQFATTRYQRWLSEAREYLFDTIQFTALPNVPIYPDQFAKYANATEYTIFQKVKTKGQSAAANLIYQRQTSHFVFYQEATQYWVKAVVGLPYYAKNGSVGAPAHGRYSYFSQEEHAYTIAAVLNSSLFYVYFVAYSDGFHLSNELATGFPLTPELVTDGSLITLSKSLMADLQNNAERKRITTKDGDEIEYHAFFASKSKPIIDEIDRVLAQHYGFTDEELDFIINYDFKYRTGDELSDEDGGQE